MDEIRTERLVLRNFKVGDAQDLLAYLRDPSANCFLSLRLQNLEEAAAEAAKRGASDDDIAVYSLEHEKVIGDLFATPEGEGDTLSVGWHLNGDFAGRGYAYEAARALFRWLFEGRQIRRLYAYVEDDNIASQRLCEKLRMRREGLFLEFVSFTKDEAGHPLYENTMQYAILRREWEARA
ncbi:ribosomal-protein-alanine N-acetyltransferase [Agrobacterium larrymoorei]|uniref:Ribosomal-protein-alanine N-acetyltransferase n=1 Tax=Agrobacterium larrymoorei TaxID=160699 RepID=A0AAJ2EQH7_9HYPH|nr:GNAT family protein [Agrobacterium larrymoorei]MDR6100644.1 ribosomal-protein-alanine N-acetyltransferase [Agrobacterium larrymoorei]